MAASGLRTKLERELECSFCLERLKDPRVFPQCQHSFCYQCVVDLSEGKRKISCPECRTEVEVGNPPDLSKFKRIFRVNNILEHMELTTMNNCETHEGEQYKYYCKTCKTPTCKDCTLQDHREHDYCPIQDITEDFRNSLADKLGKLREQKGKVSDNISHFEKLESKFKMTNGQVHVEINQHFDALVESVESQREKLIARANRLTESKLQITGMKIDDLQLTEACLASNIHYIETQFDNFKDEEVINVEKRISEDLKNYQFGDEYEHSSIDNDMKFLVLPSDKDFEKCLVESRLVANNDVCPEKCTSSLEASQLKKGEQAVITVTCKDSTNCDIKHGGQIIKAEFSGNATVRQAGNDDRNDGTHDITFVPISQGELIVKLYINGQEAPNCMLKTTVRRDSKIFR